MSYPYKMLKLLLAWSHQSFQRFSCRLSVGKQMRQPPRPRTCCHSPIYTYQGVSCSGSYWTSTKTTDLSAHHFGSLHPWSEAGALILLPVIMISLTPHPLGVGFCEFSVIQFIFEGLLLAVEWEWFLMRWDGYGTQRKGHRGWKGQRGGYLLLGE